MDIWIRNKLIEYLLIVWCCLLYLIIITNAQSIFYNNGVKKLFFPNTLFCLYDLVFKKVVAIFFNLIIVSNS